MALVADVLEVLVARVDGLLRLAVLRGGGGGGRGHPAPESSHIEREETGCPRARAAPRWRRRQKWGCLPPSRASRALEGAGRALQYTVTLASSIFAIGGSHSRLSLYLACARRIGTAGAEAGRAAAESDSIEFSLHECASGPRTMTISTFFSEETDGAVESSSTTSLIFVG